MKMSSEFENGHGFKRDETPYLVFPCSKCKQYHYVKTTQKGKKCLRCGRHHKVENYLKQGEIVKGMTTALELVKKKQNQFGGTPDLNSENEFIVAGNKKPQPITKSKPRKTVEGEEIDYYDYFLTMLEKIKEQFIEFPGYLLRMMAPEYDIPLAMTSALKNKAVKEGQLIKLKEEYFKIKN